MVMILVLYRIVQYQQAVLQISWVSIILKQALIIFIKTTPVVVYNTETINNKEYYVPVTKRIETNENDIDTKVSIMLNEMDYDKPLSLVDQCSLQDGTLSIHLAANILNDNESIDNTLYNRIVKSASHLENVKKVSLFVDNQEIDPVQDVNGEVDNRIKM